MMEAPLGMKVEFVPGELVATLAGEMSMVERKRCAVRMMDKHLVGITLTSPRGYLVNSGQASKDQSTFAWLAEAVRWCKKVWDWGEDVEYQLNLLLNNNTFMLKPKTQVECAAKRFVIAAFPDVHTRPVGDGNDVDPLVALVANWEYPPRPGQGWLTVNHQRVAMMGKAFLCDCQAYMTAGQIAAAMAKTPAERERMMLFRLLVNKEATDGDRD